MEIIIFLVALAIVIIPSIAICVRELLIIYYNPIPKFDDMDKSINEIVFTKTRSISGTKK